MAKIKVPGFEGEADLTKIEEIATERLPLKIEKWLIKRKNEKNIKREINKLKRLAFSPWRKYVRKFHIYENFALPKSLEQVKADVDYDMAHIQEPEHDSVFDSNLEREFAHHDFIERFYKENGGQGNFGVCFERALKLNGFTMMPIRKIYTYSKNEKAVLVLEEFRPIENSYCIFAYCTKNWEKLKL